MLSLSVFLCFLYLMLDATVSHNDTTTVQIDYPLLSLFVFHISPSQELAKQKCNSNLHRRLRNAFTIFSERKQSIDYLRRKLWPSIENEMNLCLILHKMHDHHHQQNTQLSTVTFNQFLNFIIAFEVGAQNGTTLQLIDEYYLLAKEVGIQLSSATFNFLLKANRLSPGGIRGKLLLVHMNEMIEYGIAADSLTIVELLSMCARSPRSKTMNGTMTNKQVADAEFKYYLHHTSIVAREKYAIYGTAMLSPSVVFTAYLKVYSNDGDLRGMHRVSALARSHRIRIDKKQIEKMQQHRNW